jgi:hypothetical protein
MPNAVGRFTQGGPHGQRPDEEGRIRGRLSQELKHPQVRLVGVANGETLAAEGVGQGRAEEGGGDKGAPDARAETSPTTQACHDRLLV